MNVFYKNFKVIQKENDSFIQEINTTLLFPLFPDFFYRLILSFPLNDL